MSEKDKANAAYEKVLEFSSAPINKEHFISGWLSWPNYFVISTSDFKLGFVHRKDIEEQKKKETYDFSAVTKANEAKKRIAAEERKKKNQAVLKSYRVK